MSLCDLLDEYLELVDDTESPLLFHRWSMIAAVGALLSRRVKFKLPFGAIYPNDYYLLIGDPATRKSTSIKILSGILKQAGYAKIASGRTSAEQFLVDLHSGFDTLAFAQAAQSTDLTSLVSDLDLTMPVQPAAPAKVNGYSKVSDVLIAEGELVEFLGAHNGNFISLLTDYWDNHDEKTVRTKSGDKLKIHAPTVSLLGGVTHSTFKMIFPPEAIGRGALSRFILIFATGARKKSFVPKPFDTHKYQGVVEWLRAMNTHANWPSSFEFSPGAYDYSRHIYESSVMDLQDPRFQFYNGRRDTHYRKLCLIIAATNFHNRIEESDCFLANTILSYTEQFMPAALGEFGFDKIGEQTEMVYSVLRGSHIGLTMQELLNKTTSIVHNISELSGIIIRLQAGQRIERIQLNGTVRYIAADREIQASTDLVNYNLLKEYKENPSFNTKSTVMDAKVAEYELTAELQALAGDQTPAPKRGRKPKQEVDLSAAMSLLGRPSPPPPPESLDFENLKI